MCVTPSAGEQHISPMYLECNKVRISQNIPLKMQYNNYYLNFLYKTHFTLPLVGRTNTDKAGLLCLATPLIILYLWLQKANDNILLHNEESNPALISTYLALQRKVLQRKLWLVEFKSEIYSSLFGCDDSRWQILKTFCFWCFSMTDVHAKPDNIQTTNFCKEENPAM